MPRKHTEQRTLARTRTVAISFELLADHLTPVLQPFDSDAGSNGATWFASDGKHTTLLTNPLYSTITEHVEFNEQYLPWTLVLIVSSKPVRNTYTTMRAYTLIAHFTIPLFVASTLIGSSHNSPYSIWMIESVIGRGEGVGDADGLLSEIQKVRDASDLVKMAVSMLKFKQFFAGLFPADPSCCDRPV